ncbi:metalloproteinase inhibitor 2-like [Myxocyprinus asiaticus]|uniref:metalloproteinase inhibitor 2-like n=1 Tax=Myxocyprinus asiaticus TaxID=70543 RepID=UPI002221832B|nr:metalloproteinase inhibitor 2-like [Myxocyprinus asiaticus]
MGVSLSAVTFGLLLFLSVGLNKQAAEGCTCKPEHPQQLFCRSEIVIQAEITEKQEITQNNIFPDWGLIRYKFKTIQVFKGFEKINGTKYVYTPKEIGICGVSLDYKQYLLSGHVMNGGLVVTLCDFVYHWDRLSLTQKYNLKARYQMGCKCKVSVCYEKPCCLRSQKECLWTDWELYVFIQNGEQAREFTCIMNNEETCSWYKGSSKVDTVKMCKS